MVSETKSFCRNAFKDLVDKMFMMLMALLKIAGTHFVHVYAETFLAARNALLLAVSWVVFTALLLALGAKIVTINIIVECCNI